MKKSVSCTLTDYILKIIIKIAPLRHIVDSITDILHNPISYLCLNKKFGEFANNMLIACQLTLLLSHSRLYQFKYILALF